MNVRQVTQAVFAAGMATVLAGCATTGGSQLESSIYDTHRMVKNLDTNLQPSVAQLNQTAAGMDARLTATDEQTRRLQAMAEENQRRLDELQHKLDELNRMVAIGLGLSSQSRSTVPPPTTPGSSSSPMSTEGVTMGPSPTAVTPVPPADIAPTPPATASVEEPVESLEPMPSQTLAGGNATSDYEKAITSYRDGNYELAIQQFDEYMKRYPDNQYCANSQYWKAYSYAKLKNYDEAVREFEKMRALYPNDQKIPLAMYNQAAALSNLGKIAECKALLQKLIAEHPNDAAAQAARGDLAKLQG